MSGSTYPSADERLCVRESAKVAVHTNRSRCFPIGQDASRWSASGSITTLLWKLVARPILKNRFAVRHRLGPEVFSPGWNEVQAFAPIIARGKNFSLWRPHLYKVANDVAVHIPSVGFDSEVCLVPPSNLPVPHSTWSASRSPCGFHRCPQLSSFRRRRKSRSHSLDQPLREDHYGRRPTFRLRPFGPEGY
jgi:hypothetical protein